MNWKKQEKNRRKGMCPKFKHFFSTQKKCVPESLTFSVRIFLNGSTTNNILELW